VEVTATLTATPVPVTISHIVIRDAADGFGATVVTHTMNAGEAFIVYAAAYDTEGNYLWDVPANWSLTGSLVQAVAEPAPTEEVTTEPEPEAVVTEEPVPDVAATEEPVQEGEAVIEESPTQEPVPAAEEPTVEAQQDTRTKSFTFTPAAAGEGTIVADDGNGHAYETELITVVELPKEPEISHITIRDAADGFGNQVMTVTLTVSDTFALYAAAYDIEGNYIKDTPVTWTTTGTLDPITVTEAISMTFVPVTPNTAGTIVADDGTGRTDETDAIQVIALMRSDIGTLSSRTAAYTSRVFVQNPNSSTSTYSVNFYRDTDGALYEYTPAESIPGHGTAVINVGSITTSPALPDGFRGGAVVSSDSPVGSVAAGIATNGDITVYNGFSGSDGNTELYAPALNKGYTSAGQTSIISIQNTGSGSVDFTIYFYNRDGTDAGNQPVTGLGAGKVYILDLANYAGITAPWNGAAFIQATGNVVGVVTTLNTGNDQAFSYECLTRGYTTVYLPTAQYQYTTAKQTTYVALQNPNSFNIVAVVTYYNKTGGQQGNTLIVPIPPRQKANAHPNTAGIAAGYLGSGKVMGYVDNGSGQPDYAQPANVIGMANLSGTIATLTNSFVGVGNGGTSIAIPFGQWATASTEWNTYVAVQNVDPDAANITIKYYGTNGVEAHSVSFTNVGSGIKVNTKPSEFTSSAWQGSVEVTSDQPVQALVNVSRQDSKYAGIYTGVIMTP